MNREEHLAWAKQRALEYLSISTVSALNSFFSDLQKHPELQGHLGIRLARLMVPAGKLRTPEDVTKFINDFQ